MKLNLKFLTYLASSINVAIVCLQLIFLFFESGVIQLTLTHRLLKVETNTVGFTIAKYFTDCQVKGVNAANHVML